MAQCTATAAKTGLRCRRSAVSGADCCPGHGGLAQSLSPKEIRRRNPRKKCSSHRSGPEGAPCGNYAIKGSTVCLAHGGRLPTVKAKARERLMEMIDPAVVHLRKIITKESTSDADRLRAIQMLLDRTGFGPRSEVLLTPKPWEALVSEGGGVLVEVDYGPVIQGEVVHDHSAALQAEHDQRVYDMTPNAPVIALPVRHEHPVAASRSVPQHLRG